ncbi:uncharacterized protein LOC114362323 [Ostrinia furnacalis]|uniref:uncharacterized protein LOC114362323 n=1 Tax=Ostrinia furnacalis TaxID=93504 RepID=UPI00103FA0F3|nr:uncharacterized protein LOC114362323 [Ostrinia furnacalis]
MFAGKVVLLTGASSGIGAETALHFAKQEAILALVGRNKDNLEKAAKKCEEVSPKKLKPITIIADVNNETDLERVINTTIEQLKQIDVLVNNAGIMTSGSIETTSLEQYDKIMTTNVRAPYYLTMLAVPHLLKTKGNIVNVSSVAGVRSFPNILAYCVSKSALDQFTRCVALELGPKGVRVNAVNPGVVITEIHMRGGMSEKDYEAYIEKCKMTHALGRPGQTEEVASAILFLAGSGASNITGVTLSVDGGRGVMCPR